MDSEDKNRKEDGTSKSTTTSQRNNMEKQRVSESDMSQEMKIALAIQNQAQMEKMKMLKSAINNPDKKLSGAEIIGLNEL